MDDAVSTPTGRVRQSGRLQEKSAQKLAEEDQLSKRLGEVIEQVDTAGRTYPGGQDQFVALLAMIAMSIKDGKVSLSWSAEKLGLFHQQSNTMQPNVNKMSELLAEAKDFLNKAGLSRRDGRGLPVTEPANPIKAATDASMANNTRFEEQHELEANTDTSEHASGRNNPAALNEAGHQGITKGSEEHEDHATPVNDVGVPLSASEAARLSYELNTMDIDDDDNSDNGAIPFGIEPAKSTSNVDQEASRVPSSMASDTSSIITDAEEINTILLGSPPEPTSNAVAEKHLGNSSSTASAGIMDTLTGGYEAYCNASYVNTAGAEHTPAAQANPLPVPQNSVAVQPQEPEPTRRPRSRERKASPLKTPQNDAAVQQKEPESALRRGSRKRKINPDAAGSTDPYSAKLARK